MNQTKLVFCLEFIQVKSFVKIFDKALFLHIVKSSEKM